jgi:hypothetical protein
MITQRLSRLFFAPFIVIILVLILSIGTITRSSAFPSLEVIAELQQMPGNIAVTADRRLIISQHQFAQPTYRVMELLATQQNIPFPNEAWSRAPNQLGVGLDSVLGLRATTNGKVWLLDNGMRQGSTPKLVVWDTQKNVLDRVIYLPFPISLKGSFHNDLAIDTQRQKVYISDVGTQQTSAIVVIDLNTGAARRVLQGHRSVIFEDVSLTVEGKLTSRLNADGTLTETRLGVSNYHRPQQ